MNETLKNALLEAIRLALSAAVGAITDYALVLLNSGVLNNVLPLSPEVNALIIGIVTTFVKSWDRGIHEDPTTSSKGFLPL